MNDAFNMSIRKFLKQVGVTSQRAIETALQKAKPAAGQKFKAKIVLTIEGLNLEHVVEGSLQSNGGENQ